MVDKDVVLEKVAQIQRCLRRIHEKTKGDPASLEDHDAQDVFILNLQRAIQSTIDLASHIIADEGLGLPTDLKDNFILLERAKILNKELSKKMQRMVGFRNIAVHDYTSIDEEVLRSVLKKDLKDIEGFYSKIMKYFRFN